MTAMTILFLHGWQSVPGGVKPSYLVQHGHQVINPKLPDDDFDEAIRIAQEEFDKHRPEVVVGSSRGGAVAMNINSGDARLVLICPAWKKWGTAKTVRPSTVILHSRSDDVVPFADSEQLVMDSGLPSYTLIETGSDRRLADPESLDLLLLACADDNEMLMDDTPEDLLGREFAGDCYGAAMNWIRVAEEEDWVVIHGTVWSEKCGKRIDHAWCERAGWVVDLAQPVGAKLIKRDQYYRVVQAEIRNKYSSEDALVLSLKHRHQGPWDESEKLNG